jgi:hypothetical protein
MRCRSGSAKAAMPRHPRYRLDVLLDDNLEGLGLLTGETIGRERRTLRARYQLGRPLDRAHRRRRHRRLGRGHRRRLVRIRHDRAEQTALENCRARLPTGS